MHCELFKENLFAFHEKSLTDGLRQSMETHLASCESCRKLNAGFASFSEILEMEKATKPNPFTATRILQRIEAEFERPYANHGPFWVRILQPVALAIALAAGIFIGSYTAKNGNTPPGQLVNKTDHIEFLKSDLYISEFTDEDKILILNK